MHFSSKTMRTLLLAAPLVIPSVSAIAETHPKHYTPISETSPMLPDTSRVVEVDEAVVVASPKETSRLRWQPLASSSYDAATLALRGVERTTDLSALAPNLYMPSYGSKITSAVYIRGIGTRMNTPAVGLYVDNVPYLDKSAYNFSFTGIERIDVLRGPQGTLYGRNAMGGLIRIYTANPLTHRGTEIELGGSTHNGGRKASFNTFLHPRKGLALSLSGYYNGSEGFYENITTGKKADGGDAGGVRLRLAHRYSDLLKIDFNAGYEYSDERACPYFYDGAVGKDGNITSPNDDPYADLRGLISANHTSRYRRSMFNSGLNLTWFAPKFTVSSITAYQMLRDRLHMDQDFISPDIYTLTQSQRMHNFTEEISLKSLPGRRWNWTTGLFSFYQNLNTECPVTFNTEGVSYLNSMLSGVFKGLQQNYPQMPAMGLTLNNANIGFLSSMHTPSVGAALFHESTIKDVWVPGLSFTAGLRLDYDHRSLDLQSLMSSPVAYSFWMGSPYAAQSKDPVAPHVEGDLNDNTWQLLPKFGLQYELGNHRGNVYATAAKGYRAGGYNIQAYSDLAQAALQRELMLGAMGKMASAMGQFIPSVPDVETLSYKPETSWNYEVGAKLNFFDGALRADVAAFWLQTRNQQLARFAESGMGRVMVNAGRSRSIGMEASLRGALLSDRLMLTANYGFTDARFTSHNLGDGTDYTDNRVPFVPRHTFTAAADFSQKVSGERFVRSAGGGVAVNSAGNIVWDEANSFSQPFHATLDAYLAVQLAGNIGLKIWGRNLTDTRYATFSFDSMSRRYTQLGAPRHFGADLTIKF